MQHDRIYRSDLWQQLLLAFELGSDLRGTDTWGRKWLAFSLLQLTLFDWSNNSGTVDVKMDGSVLEEKTSFKILGISFSSTLDWDLQIVCIAKTASKKI